MPGIFDKLQLGTHRQILLLDAPPSFDTALQGLQDVKVERELAATPVPPFVLVFAREQAAVDRWSRLLAARTVADVVLWFAYPKGSSKKFSCDFNRDTGWTVLRSAGFDTVRQIAIDEDWTALRLRRVAFIKR